MDRMRLYDIAYALAARDGREAALFGNCAPAAREAFARSLTNGAFPELWFEAPLVGEPWLDFHALTSYEDVAGKQPAFAGHGGVYADALTWFSEQEPKTVRQLALSYDTSADDVSNPAVQLLVSTKGTGAPVGFLETVGHADAGSAFRAFVDRIPREWFACYVGVFPRRSGADADRWVRIECIVSDELQHVYANDGAVLREHLAQVGLGGLDGSTIAGIQTLAQSPFALELQFNVGTNGVTSPVLAASVRFQPFDWSDPSRREIIAALMRRVQDGGLADERWKLFAGTVFAKQVQHGGEIASLSCFPAFVKLRWREGAPPDAKSYLMLQVEEARDDPTS